MHQHHYWRFLPLMLLTQNNIRSNWFLITKTPTLLNSQSSMKRAAATRFRFNLRDSYLSKNSELVPSATLSLPEKMIGTDVPSGELCCTRCCWMICSLKEMFLKKRFFGPSFRHFVEWRGIRKRMMSIEIWHCVLYFVPIVNWNRNTIFFRLKNLMLRVVM